MKNITEYKVILWDFDGVIMDSMPIRSLGFKKVLQHYPAEQLAELLKFHQHNGGLSRYVKFRYFFEKIRNEPITEAQILALADQFSGIMLGLLFNKKLLINDSVNFIKHNPKNQEMHIVSGSDGTELKQICEALNLNSFFKTINGSPTPKKELVKQIISSEDYTARDFVLIGDSINDWEAAQTNGIDFCGYNNPSLKSKKGLYIDIFQNIT
jgi:phosphoglycolate phosphatase-like HAD superfamily hydrolase